MRWPWDRSREIVKRQTAIPEVEPRDTNDVMAILVQKNVGGFLAKYSGTEGYLAVEKVTPGKVNLNVKGYYQEENHVDVFTVMQTLASQASEFDGLITKEGWPMNDYYRGVEVTFAANKQEYFAECERLGFSLVN